MFDPFSAGFEWDDGMMNLAKRKWSRKTSGQWRDLTAFFILPISEFIKSRQFHDICFIRSPKEIFLKVKCNEILIDLDKSEVHKIDGIEFVPI